MLTDAAIRKALKTPKPQTLSDGSGRGTGRLVLMIRPPATVEWYAQRYESGKRRLVKLGRFPDLSLADARERFRSGGWQAAPLPCVGTVEDLFNDYVSYLEAQGMRSAANVRLTLKRMGAAIGAEKPANAVTTSDLLEALRPIYAAGKASMADHMRSYVRSAYGWALKAARDYRTMATDRYHLSGNPAEHIPSEGKTSGERWLDTAELRQFWRWLAAGGGVKNPNRNINPLAYPALQMIACTGQRVEEICRLHSAMVNWKAMVIEWPTTKPGRPHVLPLSIQSAAILYHLQPNEHGLYFPAENGSNRPMRDHTLRVVAGRFCSQEGVRHFAPRDLRRTWKTLSGMAGLSKVERDLLQNHARSDVSSRHYDRYDYLSEKRAGMKAWGEWFRREVE